MITLIGSSCGALFWDTLDTINHPAHQRHAAFTPACFALPSGTAPRKRTFHQGRANPNGIATSRTSCRHTVCPHTYRSKHITRYPKLSRSPATRRVYTSMFRAPQWHGAAQTHFPPRPRNSQWHCDITSVISPHGLPITLEANMSHDTTNHPAHQRHAAFTSPCFPLPSGVARRHANTLSTKAVQTNGTATSRTSCRHTVCPHTRYTRLPPRITLRVCKTSISSQSRTPSLQNERFVRDFLKNSYVMVCKTRVSYEISTRKHPSGRTHLAAPPSSFAIPSPPTNTRSCANPNAIATFTSTTCATHNLTIRCACHESFRVHASDAHKVLRLPRNVTSVTPRNLTIPCACHENRTSASQNRHNLDGLGPY